MKFIARNGTVLLNNGKVEAQYLTVSPELKQQRHKVAEELAEMFNDKLQKGLLQI